MLPDYCCWQGSWSKRAIPRQPSWSRIQLRGRIDRKLHHKYSTGYGRPHLVQQTVHRSISTVLGSEYIKLTTDTDTLL